MRGRLPTRPALSIPLLLVALLLPSLAGCIDLPDEAASSLSTGGVREVELLDTQVRLDAVDGMEHTLDVDVPTGAETVTVRVTIDGVANRLTWSGPGERCAGHAGLYVSQSATTSSQCVAPEPGTHPLTLRLRSGAATLDVVVEALVRDAPE